jgi:hypothetical protein
MAQAYWGQNPACGLSETPGMPRLRPEADTNYDRHWPVAKPRTHRSLGRASG